VTVHFEQEVKKSVLEEKGIKVIDELKKGFVLNAKGDINPLLAALHELNVADIEITHGSLQDIFLEHYQ